MIDRAGGLLRRHWVMAVLLAAGIALRVITMIAYRPAILYIDSMSTYLPNLKDLAPNLGDPIGYDLLLLKPVLAVGNLATVAAVQHLLGLGMAITAYLLLVHKGAWRWLAALATAPVLLDAYQLQIEHNIMADTLFEALLVAALAVLAWPRRPRWPHVLVAGVLFGLATTVRQAGEPLIVAAVIYAVLMARGWRWRVGLAAIAAGAFLLPVTAYASYYAVDAGRFGISAAGSSSLYGRVATFADCKGLALPSYERQLCPISPVSQRRGPDFWAHDDVSPATRLVAPPGMSVPGVLSDFDKRIIKHQPLDFVGSVLGDAAKVFSWNRPINSNPDAPTWRWQFQTTFPVFEPLVTIQSITQENAQFGDGPPTVNEPLAHGLRWYQLHLGFTPGPVVAVSLLLAAAGALGLGRARRSALRGPALLYLLTGAGVLLFADLFEFTWRYQLPGYPILPVAGVFGLMALVGRPAAPRAPFPEPADDAAIEEFTTRYGEPKFPDVLVVIAAYNEAEGIGPVVDSVPGSISGLSVATLVVVDGAKDASAEVAREHGAFVCDIPVNRGQGAALRLGYHLARIGGARFIVTTDADGQYDMTELATLLGPLLADEADFVTGSRRLGANESPDRVRRLGTRVFATIVSVLTGHRVTDTSFGFRAMRAEVTGQVTLAQPQYQSSELLVGVLSHGYRVVERPMTMRRRAGGSTKKGNNLVYGARYARVVFSTWARERKTTRSSTTNLTTNIAA